MSSAVPAITTIVDYLAPSCEPGKCRVNCRKNPNCFTHIGEKFWFGEIKDSHWLNNDCIEYDKKEKDCHVGLKNLGATCYVNTFLQLWFHNKAFRSAVYQWEPKDNVVPTEIVLDPGDSYPKTILLDYGDNPTNKICGNLQFLFALLQYSEKRYVDPSSFVQSLGLQTDEQQDAQEFSKLFISLLDDSLSAQNNFSSSIIDSQFGGSYVYQTICNVCGCTSERPSRFYELDLNIKGHIKLKECLKEFLKEEILEGDNKYFCPRCQIKQDASRKIVLKTLPPVLNLQLLRFVFERQTGTKKKLNSVINFPDILNMNDFMKLENPEDGVYNLTAVLIHRGLSAHSGHYIAHIFDHECDVWCRFNDEDVSIMKGKTLQLGKEEDLEVGYLEEKVKRSKKCDGHSSKNAYMLVYSKKAIVTANKCTEVPDNIKEFVAKDNSLFLDCWTKSEKNRTIAITKGFEKQKEIQACYTCLPVKEGADFEWISTDWLRQWLNPDQHDTPPVNNTELMCQHSRADPLKINMMKRVSAETAETLFSRYNGSPRLPTDSLCTACLDSIRRAQEFQSRLQTDMKEFVKPLKTSYKVCGESYWVGRKSLRRVKQLALQRFRNQEVGFIDFDKAASLNDSSKALEETGDQNNNGDGNNSCTTDAMSSKGTPNQTNTNFQFNQDCVCSEHGNLCANTSPRLLVSQEIWSKLLEYFPGCKSFPQTMSACQQCQNKEKSSKEERETLKYLANEQKEMFSFLLENKTNRLKIFLSQENFTVHVLLASFIKQWKVSVKSCGKKLLTHIDNSEIMCEHDLVLYTGQEIINEAAVNDGHVILITEEEFQNISNFFTISHDVTITTKVTDQTDSTVKTHQYEISPDFCTECRKNRLSEEAHDSRMYRSAVIFVMKNDMNSSQASLGNSPHGENDNMSDQESPDDKSKFYRKETKDADFTSPSSPKRSKMSAFPGRMKRRSARQRTKRREYMIRVDSDQTLKQLKIQLLSIFSVLPVEQTLSLQDGTVLQNDDAILVDLGIKAGDHLLLSVDEPNTEQSVDDSSHGKPRALEEGFKGTNLYGGGMT